MRKMTQQERMDRSEVADMVFKIVTGASREAPDSVRGDLAAAKARLRIGTEVLRTGGGTSLSIAECNALLDHLDRLEAKE